MSAEIVCPQCQSPHGYEDRDFFICPECAHEWKDKDLEQEDVSSLSALSFLDMNGVPLKDGDCVRVGVDLKVGGQTLKSGTKVKRIRLLDQEVDGHNISCKVDGFGAIYLKTSVVKKDS